MWRVPYLVRWEQARSQMRDIVDMPDKKKAQFILFTRQNRGEFPKGRRNLFSELSDKEIASLAKIVKEVIMPVIEQKISVFSEKAQKVSVFAKK